MKKILSITIIALVLLTGTSTFAITAAEWIQIGVGGAMREQYPTWQVLIGATATTTYDQLEVHNTAYFANDIGVNVATPSAKFDLLSDPLLVYSQLVKAGYYGSPISGTIGDGDIAFSTNLDDSGTSKAAVFLSSLNGGTGQTYGVASTDKTAYNFFLGNVGVATISPDARVTALSGVAGPTSAVASVIMLPSNYSNGTTAKYKVCAKFADGKYSQSCAESNTITFTGPSTTEGGRITWTAVPNATSYELSRNKNGAGYANSYDTTNTSTTLDDSDGGGFTWGALVDTSDVSGQVTTEIGYFSTIPYGLYTNSNGYFGGNLGIGTTSPYAPLSVYGQVVASYYTATTTATSTFTGGIDAARVCISGTTTCLGGSSSQWTTNGTSIYYSTGNVGIGTTTPYTALSVVGPTGVVASQYSATSTIGTSTFMGKFQVGTTSAARNIIFSQALSPQIDCEDQDQVVTTDETLCQINFISNDNSAGGFGLKGFIRSVSPAVAGLTYDLTFGAAASQIAASEMMRLTNTNRLGISTTSPWARLSVAHHNLGAGLPSFVIASSSAGIATTTQFVVTNGLVGIGTSSPYAALSVVGIDNNPAIVTNAVNATSTTATSTFVGEVVLKNAVKLAAFTVATLPTCNANSKGSVVYVTDALTPAFLVAIVGGGAVSTPVFCDGANWVSS